MLAIATIIGSASPAQLKLADGYGQLFSQTAPLEVSE